MAKYPSEAFKRQRQLTATFPDCEVTTCCNEKEAMWIVLSESFDLGIFQVDSFEARDQHFGELVRASGFDFPIIVSGRVDEKKNFFSDLARRSNTILFREPVDFRILLGVAGKLLQSGVANQPRFPRFSTNEKVQVEKFGVNKSAVSKLSNMSLGGAKIEFEESFPVPLQMGDFIKLKFNFENLKKSRVVSGQVVWVSNPEDDTRSFGISFIR